MPETAPTTRVIPFNLNDQFKPIDNIRSLLFFIVRDNINDELLKASLDKLIRQHVPILGARIHRNKKSHFLEYHLTEPFPKNHTLFDWSTSSKDTTLEAAGLLSESPPSASCPSFGPLPITGIEAAIIPQDWPIGRKDEKPNCPLLLVHVAKFINGTALALNLPHCVSDQMGYGSLVRAWLQVATGQEPSRFLELPPGALDGNPKLPRKELKVKGQYRLKRRRENITGVMGMIPEVMVNKKEIRRVLFLPTSLVDSLRTRFNDRMKEAGGEHVSLTNGDVISALLFKLTFLAHKSPKMVTLSAALNVRGRHPSLPQDKPYLHNALSWSTFRAPISKTTPLFDLVLKHRLSMTEGLKPDSIERSLTVLHEMVSQGRSIHIIEPWELSYAVTNWCGAWRDIDFGPVVNPSEQDGSGGRDGKNSSLPVVFGHSLERHHPTRFNAQIMCKADGGYWCDFTASEKAMAVVDALFEKDPTLETI